MHTCAAVAAAVRDHLVMRGIPTLATLPRYCRRRLHTTYNTTGIIYCIVGSWRVAFR